MHAPLGQHLDLEQRTRERHCSFCRNGGVRSLRSETAMRHPLQAPVKAHLVHVHVEAVTSQEGGGGTRPP